MCGRSYQMLTKKWTNTDRRAGWQMTVMDGSCWEGKMQIRTWDSWCQWRQFFASQLVTKKDKVQQVNPHWEEQHPATQTLATNHHLLWRGNWFKGRSHKLQSRAVWTAISVNTVTVYYINYSNTTKITYYLSTYRLHVGSLH